MRVTTGDAACRVISEHPAVLDWITMYLGSWWTVTPTPATSGDPEDVVLRCRLDPEAHRQAGAAVHDQPDRVVEFARKPVQVVDDCADVRAVNIDEQVAYHVTAERRDVTLIAADFLGLRLAAARIARELIRVQLEAAGWVILHASAAVGDGHAFLALGGKGAGKTTTALLLAGHGLTLLSNDRVFLHPDTLPLLPWPSAAALGLGLLRAHGLLDGVRARMVAGERLHPTVDPTVTAAILRGHDTPLIDNGGKKLKPQFFPHQLVDWLGLPGPLRRRRPAAVPPRLAHHAAGAAAHRADPGRFGLLRPRQRRPLPRLPAPGQDNSEAAPRTVGTDPPAPRHAAAQLGGTQLRHSRSPAHPHPAHQPLTCHPGHRARTSVRTSSPSSRTAGTVGQISRR